MFRVLTCLTDDHDLRLVALAGVICFLASYAAVSLLHRAMAASGTARRAWLATAGGATGCGIWATHFIAMLAYDPGVVVGYGVALTALSLAVAVAITCGGLALALHGTWRGAAPAGGAVVGGGIACMHYLGMSAVELPGHIHWDPALVSASVALGIMFGAAATTVARVSERALPSLAAAVLLTLSILAHHFTAMGAVLIVPDPARVMSSLMLSPQMLALTIAGAAAAVLGMSIVAGLIDRRGTALLSNRNVLLDAAINNMVQGVNMFDDRARLVLFNDRYLQMYRLSPDVIKPGCSVRELVENRIKNGTFFATDPEQYIAELTNAQLHDRNPSTRTLELDDGRVVLVVSQPLPNGGWVVTHEDITDRHRAAQELEKTRNFLDTVLENVPATIIVKDARDLRYVLLNRASEAFFGVPRERMLGRTAGEIFPQALAQDMEERDRQLLVAGARLTFDARPVEMPGNGMRLVVSSRMPIAGPDGKPQYLVNVLTDVTERKRAEAQIAHLAQFDALTDLPNRASFNECFAATLERATAANEDFALLSLDLDRFKEVNDVFGPEVGDKLLSAFAERLARTVGGAFAARLGGDEFAIIASGTAQPAGASELAERVMAATAEEFSIDEHRLHIGLSIGIAIFPTDGTDAASLIGNADAALHRAKSGGRGSIRFFEADMDQRLRERRLLVHDLHSAIDRGELLVYYQPQARLDGEITGFEALLRWRHPARGMIPPAEFIPAAEEGGLILAIGEWVLREACREATSWPKPLKIGINLSPLQFRHGDLPGLVHSVLLETGLAPGRLELEITESVLVDDFMRGLTILRRLKLLGVHIAMDDFGTGYSSLYNLQAFAFDRIKIDQSFISSLETSRQSATIVRAVIGLGRGLDLPVIAEGVETHEQLAFLTAEDCSEVQGFLVGRPMPITAYAEAVGREATPDEVASVA